MLDNSTRSTEELKTLKAERIADGKPIDRINEELNRREPTGSLCDTAIRRAKAGQPISQILCELKDRAGDTTEHDCED